MMSPARAGWSHDAATPGLEAPSRERSDGESPCAGDLFTLSVARAWTDDGGHLRLPKTDLRRRSSPAARRRRAEIVGVAGDLRSGRAATRPSGARRTWSRPALAAVRSIPRPCRSGARGAAGRVYFHRRRHRPDVSAASRDLRPGAYGIPEPPVAPRSPDPADVCFSSRGGIRSSRQGGSDEAADTTTGRWPAYPHGLCALGLAVDASCPSPSTATPGTQPMDAIVTERRLLWSAARPGRRAPRRT